MIFYSPNILDSPILPPAEAAHAIRVLRMGEGAEILVADGKGSFFRAQIRRADPGNCILNIIESIVQPPLWTNSLHIAIAPTKNADRTEWFCEKATEMGVNRISLLRCARSERREIKTERLEKVMVSAMKQSGKALLPALDQVADFAGFALRYNPPQKFIAHCDEAGEGKLPLHKVCRPADTLILIGPEGDFSPEEIVMALKAGFAPVSLGPSRLRTETAGLAACMIWHVATG
ncbi:MAG: 16S rRNA (uracil(1498)-N(3))-methyltransferase [Tannerellaceae bacterium]|nr:16S rRNA (uracil(1498)-N(3))-methyltransferase [Tannerellaceae bacterium]